MLIEVVDYTKTIKNIDVLANVNLRFSSGNVYGLQGINGSGKTMLLRAIAGLIKPTFGYVKIEGEIIGEDMDFPKSIGLLLETPLFIDKYTGFTNLKLLSAIKGKISSVEIEQSLHEVGLDPSDHRPFRKYSLGMKQRLGIACAIMEKPELILLDEPSNSLDETGLELLRTIVLQRKANGCLVIIATHDAGGLGGLVDEVIRLEGGSVISSTRC